MQPEILQMAKPLAQRYERQLLPVPSAAQTARIMTAAEPTANTYRPLLATALDPCVHTPEAQTQRWLGILAAVAHANRH
jgi:hypothetical protein